MKGSGYFLAPHFPTASWSSAILAAVVTSDPG